MTFAFAGCSFTVGVGLDFEQRSPYNYTNIVSTQYNATCKNIAKGGNSNYNIFMSALNEVVVLQPEVLFVQWSGLNRLWMYPGPDTELSLSNFPSADYRYRGISFTKNQLDEFVKMHYMLNCDFKLLLDVIEYSNLLSAAASNKTKVVFINGLLPWTGDIADSSTMTNYSNKLSAYSKEVLEFDERDDAELDKFFTTLNAGVDSLDKTQWVNLFDSMLWMQTDYGTDGQHPGLKSHQQYADMIIKHLENN